MITVSLIISTGISTYAQDDTRQFPRELESELQAVLDESVAEGRAPGAVLWVVTPQGDFQGASGWADQAKTMPLHPTDAFRIGSITKLFTATLILQLVEEDYLDLDTPVKDWLPQVMARFTYGDGVTVRHLLNHTSGLPEYSSFDNFMQLTNSDISREWSPLELIHLAESQPTHFYPDNGWHYTNTNYILLGMLIETVTGQSLAQNYQEHIFIPLNLMHTYLAPLENPPIEIVEGHSSFIDPNIFNPSMIWGAGALVSNAPDLIIFMDALMAGALFQEPATLELMLSFVTTGRGAETEWGLGLFQHDSSLGIYWGHDGALAGYLSALLYFPDKEITIVLLINADGQYWIQPTTIIDMLTPYFAE